MSNLKFSVHQPLEELSSYVRRVLVTIGNEKTLEKVPFAPTGFGYLTYSRFKSKFYYSYREIDLDRQLYLVNQLNNEQPYLLVEGNFFHVGLELYPTAPYYLFGISGDQLVDTGMIMEDVDTQLTHEILLQVNEMKEGLDVACAMQTILLKKLRKINPIDFLEDVLACIYLKSGNVEVKDLIKKSGVSERHFRRVFKKTIGIGPKKYCKVIQFNSAFEAIQIGNEEQLYELALKYGYYDHSHFINDFKAILGQSPQDFLKSDHYFLKNYLGAVK